MANRPKKDQQAGRVALRVEGDNWNAYWAMPDTMEGAVFLGSIAMRFVQSPERKAQFLAFMRDCMGDLIEEKFGVKPIWHDPLPAPEKDRTRN